MENINFKGKAITVASHFILDWDTAHISKTIIDGSDYDHIDSASTVMMCTNEDTTSVLMGFTITGGQGSKFLARWGGASDLDFGGGGVAIVNAGGKICHNIIEKNQLDGKGRRDYVYGGGIYANVNGNHTAIIRGNLIRNNILNGRNLYGAGVLLAGGRIILEDNTISQNIQHATIWTIGTGIYWSNFGSPGVIHEVIIRNNVITDNIGNSSANTNFGGTVILYLQIGQETVQFNNNVIAHNYNDCFGGGIYLGATKAAIFNNTIYNNVARRGGNNIAIEANPEAVFFNNIIWSEVENENRDFYFADKGFAMTAEHNLLKEPFKPEEKVSKANNIFMNPLIVNDGTFQLAENSPAIGRGIDSIFAYGSWYYGQKTDLAGQVCPNNIDSHKDLGALESGWGRTPLSSSKLALINHPDYMLDPEFKSDFLKYKVKVPDNFNSPEELHTIPEDYEAQMDINYASDILSENVADRTTIINVVSTDASSEMNYEVEYIPLSTDASLSELSVSPGEFQQAFSPDTTLYTVLVPYGTTETPSISCETNHEMATCEVIDALDITRIQPHFRTSSIIVTSEFGEAYTTKYKIQFEIGTGNVKDFINSGDLQVYPNPFTTELTLEWKSLKALHKIDMLNIMGQTVKSINHLSGNSVTISRDNLPSGIYFLKIYSDETHIIKVMIE